MPRESSVVLKALLSSLYDEDGYNRAKIAAELALPTTELEYLLSGLTMTAILGGGHKTPEKQTNLRRIK